MSSQVGLILLN